MFPLTFITITAIQLAYPYVSSDKLSCTEPDRDAEYLLHLTEIATLWNEIKMNFITGFSDGRRKFHDRLQVAIAGLMISMVSRMPNKMQNELHDKGDKSKGTWITICEDLNQIIYS